MNRLLPLFLIVLLFFCGQCVQKGNPDVADKESLLNQIDKFNTAFAEGNVDRLRQLVTDQYIHTNGHSTPIRKESWFEYLDRRTTALQRGELVVENYSMDDITVELYGNTAIVMAHVSFTSIVNHARKENAFRVTNIWVNEKGLWKRAGFHDTRIP